MESEVRIQILYKAVWFSPHTNTLRKGMNVSVLPPPIGN